MRLRSSSLRSALAGALGVVLIVSVAAGAGDAPPEPDWYRESDYREPTPATLKGATHRVAEQEGRELTMARAFHPRAIT